MEAERGVLWYRRTLPVLYRISFLLLICVGSLHEEHREAAPRSVIAFVDSGFPPCDEWKLQDHQKMRISKHVPVDKGTLIEDTTKSITNST
jgi:hypothetical protein